MDSESETHDARDRTVGGTGEEASLGASGSSGEEWIGAEYDKQFDFYREINNGSYRSSNFKIKEGHSVVSL